MSSVKTAGRSCGQVVWAAALVVAWLAGPLGADQGTGHEDPWQRLPEILAGIVAPSFPTRECRITDYGAVADSATDSTAAIRDASARPLGR